MQIRIQTYCELKDNKTDTISNNNFSPFSPMLPFFQSSIASAPWQRKSSTESGSSAMHRTPQFLTNHAGTPECSVVPRSTSLIWNSKKHTHYSTSAQKKMSFVHDSEDMKRFLVCRVCQIQNPSVITSYSKERRKDYTPAKI